MISCIIPYKNESDELLYDVVVNLIDGASYQDIRLVIVNDGSMNTDGSFKKLTYEQIPWHNTKIVNNESGYGVGYSFDIGAYFVGGENLVIMGSDVFPQKGWRDEVNRLCKENEIGCCCSIGLSPNDYDINKGGRISRYGANLLFKVTINDLPSESPLREDPNYRDILEAKWASKKSDNPYEIECLLGAFYFMKQKFFFDIHGWDTKLGERFQGVAHWGCLEPHLSLKAKAYGGKLMMYPDFKVGHVFGKFKDDDVYNHRAVRDDLKWWNKLWVCHTLLDDDFRDEIINFPHHSLNFGMAQAYIRRNWDKVQEVRERNKREGKLIAKNDVIKND